MGDAKFDSIVVGVRRQNPLIVVGHKSGHAIARLFIGSVAEKLAASSPFPVWIHRGNKIIVPRKILIPSDLERKFERAFRGAEAFKDSFHSDLKLRRARGMILNSIRNHSKKFDLIALSSNKLSKKSTGLGRTLGKLVRSSDKPVLVMP